MAFKLPRIEATIQMVDRVAAPMRKINQSIASAMAPVNALQNSIQSLSKEMHLGKLSAAAMGLKDKMGGIGQGATASFQRLGGVLLGAGGVVGGMGAFLKTTADASDAINDTAGRVGVSTDMLQRWRFAAQLSGSSIETLDNGMEKFGKNLSGAMAGTGEASAALQAMGIKIKDNKGKLRDQEAILLDVADAMAKIPAAQDRLRVSSALFGRGNAELTTVMSQGRAGIQGLFSDFKKAGGPIPKKDIEAAAAFNDTMDSLKFTTMGLSSVFSTQLFPVVTKLIEQYQGWATANQGTIQQVAADLAQKLPGAIEGVVSAIQGLVEAAKPVIAVFQFLSSIFGTTTVVLTVLGAYIAGPLVLSVLAAVPALITLTTTFIAAIPPAIAFAAAVLAVTWPALAVVAAIAAVGAAVYLLYRNWDSVSKFLGTSVGRVLSVLFPFTGIPLQIIKHWGGIKAFFSNLWNSVLAGAGKVRSVLESIPILGSMIGSGPSVTVGPAGSPVTGAAASATQSTATARATETSSRLAVDFTNLPMGARIGMPVGNAPVDISAGYSMAGVGGF